MEIVRPLQNRRQFSFGCVCRLGWLPGTAAIGVLTLLTAYSGFLISRLVQTVSGAILFGDIGEAAAGSKV